MNKIMVVGLKASVITLSVGVFGGIKTEKNEGMIYSILSENPFLFSSEQKKIIYDEVMKNEIIQFLDLRAPVDSPEYGATREIVEGYVAESIKKAVGAEKIGAQASQAIFNSIQQGKGSNALTSVKSLLTHLHARLLEYFETEKTVGVCGVA